MYLSLVIFAAIIPALALLYFIYRKDKYEKEPVSQLIKGFIFGALAVFASLLVSIPFLAIGLYPAEATTIGGHLRTALFSAAVPEELAKFFFLWLLLRNNRHFNEYVDGIVYAVCVGMGFAAIENIGYLFSNFNNWASVGIVRAIFSIPGHFFFAVAMGYFYSTARFGNPGKSKLNYILAITVPILLHAAFDGCLMVSNGFGLAGAAICTFLGLYIYMAASSKSRFERHLAIDDTTRKVDFLIKQELADAEDGRKDNPVGEIIYLPDNMKGNEKK